LSCEPKKRDCVLIRWRDYSCFRHLDSRLSGRYNVVVPFGGMRENGSTTSSKSPERFRHETEQAYPMFDGDKEVSYGRIVGHSDTGPKRPSGTPGRKCGALRFSELRPTPEN
jgi:hypothetical protein